jgi:hypothetical protein
MKLRIVKNITAMGLFALLVNVSVRANTIDLTTGGSGTINTGFFTATDTQSSGSGMIQSFVRIAGKGKGSVTEGYNADARPVMPDVNTSPTFTRDILLSEVGQVVNPIGAVAGTYYEFLLDINQQAANSLLSLDSFILYTSPTALTDAAQFSDLTSGATERYNLGVGNEILLDYNLNSGSGSGDMFAYIPVSLFAGAANTDYVYLYSQFGAKGGAYAENAGFEEWATRSATAAVPDGGSTAALLGLGLIVLNFAARRPKAA